MDSWCDDGCPTCNKVPPAGFTYCSAECQPAPLLPLQLPEEKPEPEPFTFAVYQQGVSARVSTWALDCYEARPLLHPSHRTNHPRPSNGPKSTKPVTVDCERRQVLLGKVRPTLVTTTKRWEDDNTSPVSPASISSPTSPSPISAAERPRSATQSLVELVSASAPPLSPQHGSLQPSSFRHAASVAAYLLKGRRGSCPVDTSPTSSTPSASLARARLRPLLTKKSSESTTSSTDRSSRPTTPRSTSSTTIAVVGEDPAEKWWHPPPTAWRG